MKIQITNQFSAAFRVGAGCAPGQRLAAEPPSWSLSPSERGAGRVSQLPAILFSR